MSFTIKNAIETHGLRNCKCIEFNDNLILIGSKIYYEDDKIKKYLLYSYLLDENLNIIQDTEQILYFSKVENTFIDDKNISIWIRDLYLTEDGYNLLVEFKINFNNEYFRSINYILHLCTIKTPRLNKVVKI